MCTIQRLGDSSFTDFLPPLLPLSASSCLCATWQLLSGDLSQGCMCMLYVCVLWGAWGAWGLQCPRGCVLTPEVSLYLHQYSIKQQIKTTRASWKMKEKIWVKLCLWLLYGNLRQPNFESPEIRRDPFLLKVSEDKRISVRSKWGEHTGSYRVQ